MSDPDPQEHGVHTARLSDKTAIVTGGTEGIGRAVVDRFIAEGARVVIVARHPPKGGLDYETVRYCAGDVRDPGTSERAVASALDWTGRVDVLVNNAARDHTDNLLSASIEDIVDVFEVNVFGALLMLQACAQAMCEAGRGSIVNVTSRLASIGVPTMSIYGASKGALLALTRGAAVELAARGVRVNAVAPGMTETPLMTAWVDQQDHAAGVRQAALDGIPQGRFGTPREVAATIAFLASDDATHITGVSIPIDGGYTAA